MIRVLSPHLDDACLSLGQWMATAPGDIEVITVLAGVPMEDRPATDYDQSCGFASSWGAMEARRLEDTRALHLLGAEPTHWSYFDGQYGPDREEDAPDVIDQIEAVYSPAELMFAPLGIGHPDHRWVAACARAAVWRHAGGKPVGLILYEELPYRVLGPEEVHDQLECVRADGWTVDPLPWPLPQGDRRHRDDKALAIGRYRSQFPDGADDPCLLVPERAWRVTR